jgi:hypothetical protein
MSTNPDFTQNFQNFYEEQKKKKESYTVRSESDSDSEEEEIEATGTRPDANETALLKNPDLGDKSDESEESDDDRYLSFYKSEQQYGEESDAESVGSKGSQKSVKSSGEEEDDGKKKKKEVTYLYMDRDSVVLSGYGKTYKSKFTPRDISKETRNPTHRMCRTLMKDSIVVKDKGACPIEKLSASFVAEASDWSATSVAHMV